MADENQNQTTSDEVKKEENNEDVKTETSVDSKEKKDKEEAGGDVEVPAKFKSIVDTIESMSVLDLNELVKLLEKKFGVSAAAVTVASNGGANTSEGGEEKSSFDVELIDVGEQKIAVIKAIKEVLGLGLKEAKDLIDSAPVMLKEGMKKDDADAFKVKIEEAGGKVALK